MKCPTFAIIFSATFVATSAFAGNGIVGGNVEVVRSCLSTVSLVKDWIGVMKFAESGDFDSARANDAEARAKHWDDWMVFSVVMGPNARKVVQSESLMGSVIVAVDDCVGQQNCRFDQFKTSAELLWANLPLACQQDFWGAI